MDKGSIQQIIRLFFGKSFSEKGRHLFGNWLRAEKCQDQKEKVLHTVWEETPLVAYDFIRSDWHSLQSKLMLSQHKNVFFRQWMQYVAIAMLVIAGGSVSWWLMNGKRSLAEIRMNECFVLHGESRLIRLDDGSEVWLNAGSLLIFPESFHKLDKRILYLTGEAYFSVSKDPDKPFIVKTSQVDVEALGTKFAVEAYPNEYTTRTTLEEGSVKVNIKSLSNQSVILKPNEQLVVDQNDLSARVVRADMDLFRLSREGYLIFEKATFTQLVHSIERKYDVTIQYNASKYAEDLYNVKFAPHETLEDALIVLRDLMDVTYQIKGDTVFLK